MSIKLTDDEVVAIAGLKRVAAPPTLLSVDIADPDQVSVAFARGVRSLSARELLEGDTIPEELEVLAEYIAGTPMFAVVHLTHELQVDLAQPRLTVVRGGSTGWIEARISGLGVHAAHVTQLDAAAHVLAECLAGAEPSARIGLITYRDADVETLEVLTDGTLVSLNRAVLESDRPLQHFISRSASPSPSESEWATLLTERAVPLR